MRYIPKHGHILSIFLFLPTFYPLHHGPKSTRLNKIHISTSKSYLSEGNFSPSCRNTLGHILLENMDDSPVCFTMLTNNISSNPIPHMVVLFLLVPLHWQENVKRGGVKGYRQQLRNFKHKGKYKIRCYPKSLLIFTAYQVHVWCTIIISPVKSQQDGSNVTEILLDGTWNTHLKHSKPCIFILQKLKNPPYGFCNHLFFFSAIILIFGGLFLHRIYRLITVKLNWLRVTTTDLVKKM